MELSLTQRYKCCLLAFLWIWRQSFQEMSVTIQFCKSRYFLEIGHHWEIFFDNKNNLRVFHSTSTSAVDSSTVNFGNYSLKLLGCFWGYQAPDKGQRPQRTTYNLIWIVYNLVRNQFDKEKKRESNNNAIFCRFSTLWTAKEDLKYNNDLYGLLLLYLNSEPNEQDLQAFVAFIFTPKLRYAEWNCQNTSQRFHGKNIEPK